MLHKQPASKNQLLTILVIAVCAVVAAAHWPVLSAKALLFDDDLFVSEDSPLVQNPGWALAGRALAEVFNPSVMVGYYQPLPVISIMADCAMGGSSSNLSPFRRTSLAIHIFNTALVIILLYCLFGQPIPAAIVGLMFGVHPLTVEPVAWISDRKTLLAMFFVLWCLIFYVRFAQKGGRKSCFACMLMYLFALMSKPTSLPVPVLMLVLDYWPLCSTGFQPVKTRPRWPCHVWRSVFEKLPFFALGILFAVITAVSNNRSLGIPLSSRLENPAQLLRTFLTVCYLTIFYLRKIFWPTGLSSVYMLPEPMSLSNRAISASVFGTIVLIAGLLFSLRRTMAFLAGLLFFFLAILPVLGIVPFSNWVVASDKYVYMPIVGLLAVLAWATTSLWRKIAVPRIALVILLLFLSSVQIYCLRRYLSHWQGTVGLFEYMLKLTPDNARVHYNLGVALQLVGRDEDTISHFQQALKLKPDYAEAHNNLGLMLAKQGSLDEALNHLQQALNLNYNYPDAHNSLGFAFQSLGRMDEAINEYREAVRIKPDYGQAYNNLGALLQKQGRFDEAISYYHSAIQFKPTLVEAHYNLGELLQKQGRLDEAIGCYRRALQIKPDFAKACDSLGAVLQAQGKLDEAIGYYQQALRIKPDLVETHNNLGILLASRSRLDEAIDHYRQALKIKPDFVQAHNNLGAALQSKGNLSEALVQYRLALQGMPDSVEINNNLAWILATHPDPNMRDAKQAIELAEHAAATTNHQNAIILNTLAAAYAAAGQFDKAIATAQQALDLARVAAKNDKLINQIFEQLENYRQGKPRTQ